MESLICSGCGRVVSSGDQCMEWKEGSVISGTCAYCKNTEGSSNKYESPKEM